MPTPVQIGTVAGSYSRTVTASLSTAPSVGNMVFGIGSWGPADDPGPTAVTVSDNQGGVDADYGQESLSSLQRSGVFFVYRLITSTVVGTFEMTVDAGPGSNVRLQIVEMEGEYEFARESSDASGQFDGGSETVNLTTGSANPDGELIAFAALTPRADGSITSVANNPPTGYTTLESRFFDPAPLVSAYKSISASETTTADFGAVVWNGGRLGAKVATYLKLGGGPTTHVSSGALAGQGSEVSGSAARTRAHGSSGALTGPGSTVVGSAARTRQHASSGDLTGQGSAVVGAAARTRAHPSSGDLTGQGSAVAGSAARTRAHPTSGDLIGPGSSVVGSADRQSAAGVHDTSGALVGQGSLIAGSANRVPNHSTTGSLVGQGSTVAGSAARFRAFSTSGVLTGQGSVIAGTAARVAGPVSHATTGVLVGSSSVVSGSAARAGPAVTHNTSGVLVGPGSIITGQDVDPDIVELLGGGPGLPRKKKKRVVRTELDKDSYLYRLLSPEQRETFEPEAAEVIEAKAVEVVEHKAEPSPKAVRAAIKDEGLAYRQAYKEIYLQLVEEIRRVRADEEEEEEAIALVLIL